MHNLRIQSKSDSPAVTLNYRDNIIELEGKSFPENAFEFYTPIRRWMTAYFGEETEELTTINIKLTYFNSASSQMLYTLFDIIYGGKQKNIAINWYYLENDPESYEDFEDINEEFPTLNIKAVKF